MSREIAFFLPGLVTGILLTLGIVAVKKFDLLGQRADRVVMYREVAGHQLSLHLFGPKAPRGTSRPTLLLFHGGAWQYGSPRQFYPQCRFFADQGLNCVSAEYRIRSRHQTDARDAVQDARAAFGYLLDNAELLGIDPQRILVGGGSSGGHLAASLGTPVSLPVEKGMTSQPVRPAGLVLYNPMLDLSPCNPDHHLVVDFWQQVSPMQHIDDLVPPTLILLGTRDREVPVPTAQAFCDELIGRGGHCELALYEGASHGFFNANKKSGDYFDQTNHRVLDFVRDIGLLDDSD